MITILDDTSVAVDTFTDLQSILQDSNDYTTVYLAADITMTAGIAILPAKTNIVIDGFYPLDGSGTIHTLSEYSNSTTGGTLGIRSASSITMTVQNMKIIGQNYYGILFVPEGSAYTGVTVIYKNIEYTGPQLTYNPNGITRYIDCIVNLQAAYSPNNEMGEVYQVEFEGTNIIKQTSTTYPVFQFRGTLTSPSVTVRSGANVTIEAGRDFMYNSNLVNLVIEPNAVLNISASYGICRSSSYRFKSVLVDKEAEFTAYQTAPSGYAMMYCDNAFTVNEGARVTLKADYSNAYPLLRFNYATGQLNLNNPERFILYSSTYESAVLYFAYATPVNIKAQQINLWIEATDISTAGTLDDPPRYSWHKTAYELFDLKASATNTWTTVTDSSFTGNELLELPALSLLQLTLASEFSVGNLPLKVDGVTSDGYPVTGKTIENAVIQVVYEAEDVPYTDMGRSDETGNFSVDTSVVIPLGNEVKITANIPFLYITVTTPSSEAGELSFTSVPEHIYFELTCISQNPELCKRADDTVPVFVTDTRIRSGEWYLYASVPDIMANEDQSKTLPEAVVFVDELGEMEVLDENPLLVYTGSANGGIPQTIEITWEEDKGILLQVNKAPVYNKVVYSTNIIWTLKDRMD